MQNSFTAAKRTKFQTKTILVYPPHLEYGMCLHYLGKLKNKIFCTFRARKTYFKCNFLSLIQQVSVKCLENKCKD